MPTASRSQLRPGTPRPCSSSQARPGAAAGARLPGPVLRAVRRHPAPACPSAGPGSGGPARRPRARARTAAARVAPRTAAVAAAGCSGAPRTRRPRRSSSSKIGSPAWVGWSSGAAGFAGTPSTGVATASWSARSAFGCDSGSGFGGGGVGGGGGGAGGAGSGTDGTEGSGRRCRARGSPGPAAADRRRVGAWQARDRAACMPVGSPTNSRRLAAIPRAVPSSDAPAAGGAPRRTASSSGRGTPARTWRGRSTRPSCAVRDGTAERETPGPLAGEQEVEEAGEVGDVGRTGGRAGSPCRAASTRSR